MTTASHATIEELRRIIAGEVLAPGDADYDNRRRVWNAMIDRKPTVIVRCRNTPDVINATRFAATSNLPIAIRGGGHNVAGHAVCDRGVMIDLSLMRGVKVDADRRHAWVEGGATWGDLDRETQRFGLATPGGLISDTGVAGLTLSGGIGWLRGRYGLCIDNLISADVVTADGLIIHAAAEDHGDLLWALRGGGGNFGVVTGFEFKLHPVGPQLMFCAPIYSVETGSAPIRFWRDFMRDKTRIIGSLIEFSTIPEDPAYPEEAWGKRVYTIAALYDGDSKEGGRLLEPLRRLAKPLIDFSGIMNYCEIQKLFDTVAPFGQYRSYWKSVYLDGLGDDRIDAILAGSRQPPSPNTLSSIWTFGGAMARITPEATAFGDRSMPYLLSIDLIWSSAADDEANIAWTRDFWRRAQAWSDRGRIYLNFLGAGEDGDALVSRTFGDNYPRLQTIKRKYDPENRFRFDPTLKVECRDHLGSE